MKCWRYVEFNKFLSFENCFHIYIFLSFIAFVTNVRTMVIYRFGDEGAYDKLESLCQNAWIFSYICLCASSSLYTNYISRHVSEHIMYVEHISYNALKGSITPPKQMNNRAKCFTNIRKRGAGVVKGCFKL